MRSGEYLIYKNQEWRIAGNKDNLNSGFVRIVSYNKSDLNNGFFLTKSDEFYNKFGFYCYKDIPKSEIIEAYEIRSHAVYKGVGASIIGCLKENWIGLRTCCLYGENEKEFLIKVNIAGFKFITREQGGTDVYGLDVSLDDPDLRIEEIRKELDINKL